MDKVDVAVQRLQAASEMSLQYYKQPLVITDSGGKDSSVCKALAIQAGIPFEVLHNHTTADAPETVRFVRQEFKRLENLGIKCDIQMPTYKGKRVSMWSLIPQKLIPPTRLVRYCCPVLKETGGAGRFISTGVRWEESAGRKGRGIYEKRGSAKKTAIILNNDNDDRRMLFENCRLKAKRVVNPIIDWSDKDVWDFIEAEKIPYNLLYDEGFCRVGCVGCPMASTKRTKEFRRWPKYMELYISAFDRMLEQRKVKGKPTVWQTGRDVFNWWMESDVLPGQIDISTYMQELLEEEDNG